MLLKKMIVITNEKLVRYRIIGAAALGCLLIFFMVRLMNQVEIKDFV